MLIPSWTCSRLTNSSVALRRRMALVITDARIPNATVRSSNAGKSLRLNGSPPVKKTWKAPAFLNVSRAANASSVVSSSGRIGPDIGRQCLHRRLHLLVTSQWISRSDIMHLPDEIERVHLKHLADEEARIVLLDPLDKSGDELLLVDDGLALDDLRHLKRRLIELHRLIAGNQKLLRVPRGDPHVPVRPEDPVASWVHFGGLAVLYFRHQFGDGLGKPADRVVDAEPAGTVRINFAATRAIEQKFARFARFADPREIAENVESWLVPDCFNRLHPQGTDNKLRLVAHPKFALG